MTTTLSPGTRLGSYEILGAIGAGGMGEVYRARDAKLNRDVAIKVMPELFATDADRLARFMREAQTLAALNHPNIAQIYGLEEGAGVPALVMELVEGKDLSAILERGPIPVPDALPIARQIADALETAHEAGIIHRDLKPANIKVRADGTVKVLDFGLAKALTPGSDTDAGDGFSPGGSARGASPAHSPTLTHRATQLGFVLGTAAYMAPEQAKGRAVDRRADIWAFGVVLWEMLTGKRLFDAEDVSETLAAVLTRDVSAAPLPDTVPRRIRALVRECLVRDPKQRLRDIGQARVEIEKIMAGVPDDAVTPLQARGTKRKFVWPAVAMLALAVAGLTGAALLMRRQSPADPVQFIVPAPEGATFAGRAFHLSPDGRSIAFTADQGGKTFVWVHSFATGTARPISATEGVLGEWVAWSPDGQSIAFRTEGRLKRASVQGGAAQTVATIGGLALGLTWNADDVILFGQLSGPIVRVSASGGRPEPVTTLDPSKQEVRHVAPEFLPDGRHFFFVAMGKGATGGGAYVGSLDSADRTPLPGIDSGVRYSNSGHVLFVRDGALTAQPFDVKRLTMGGTPVVVADLSAGGVRFGVSPTGVLAYRSSGDGASRLVWFDRAGRRLETAGPVSLYSDIELSPDERHVLYESGVPGDVWVLDLKNGIAQRVTSDAARDADPVWSPDGKTIAFRADGDDGRIHALDVGVVGPERTLSQGASRSSPSSWSPDGKHITYHSQGQVWALPVQGDSKPVALPMAPGVSADSPQISPDGRWIAYQSAELGRREVFVQAFPGPGAKQRVSVAGGGAPRWSRTGDELFYLSPGNTLMAVKVSSSAGGLNVSTPEALFQVTIRSGTEGEYDVSKTGRFLVNVPEVEASGTPITVILNWAGRLAK